MTTVPKLTDKEVLKTSLSSPWMFGHLVERYQALFLRKAQHILHSREEAEDVVQETFLKIYKNASKFSTVRNASFSSWGYKILINTCYSHLERRVRNAARTQTLDFADLDASGRLETSDSEDRVSFVRSVLGRLSPKFSRLLSLYFLEDKSYVEIAVEEKLTLSAVRSGLHRAKKQFKELVVELS